jgi:hypothetical protein
MKSIIVDYWFILPLKSMKLRILCCIDPGLFVSFPGCDSKLAFAPYSVMRKSRSPMLIASATELYSIILFIIIIIIIIIIISISISISIISISIISISIIIISIIILLSASHTNCYLYAVVTLIIITCLLMESGVTGL